MYTDTHILTAQAHLVSRMALMNADLLAARTGGQAAGVNDWGIPRLPRRKWGEDAKQRQPSLLRGNPIHPAGAVCECE